jgi:DNA-binding transcriptional MocR family regulator
MMWMAPPAMVELLIRWLTDGTAARMEADKRAEMQQRQIRATELLSPLTISAHPTGLQAWVELPEIWWGRNAAGALLEAGVSVTAGEVFETTSGAGRGHIRLALGCPSSPDLLDRGLTLIRSVLDDGPDRLGDFM